MVQPFGSDAAFGVHGKQHLGGLERHAAGRSSAATAISADIRSGVRPEPIHASVACDVARNGRGAAHKGDRSDNQK
jgi:hypothetical protein